MPLTRKNTAKKTRKKRVSPLGTFVKGFCQTGHHFAADRFAGGLLFHAPLVRPDRRRGSDTYPTNGKLSIH